MVNAIEIEGKVRIAWHIVAARMHEVVVENAVGGDGFALGRLRRCVVGLECGQRS